MDYQKAGEALILIRASFLANGRVYSTTPEECREWRDRADACMMGAMACELQTPEEPRANGRCPRCGRRLRCPVSPVTLISGRTYSRRGDSFCPDCGKAISWRESND